MCVSVTGISSALLPDTSWRPNCSPGGFSLTAPKAVPSPVLRVRMDLGTGPCGAGPGSCSVPRAVPGL